MSMANGPEMQMPEGYPADHNGMEADSTITSESSTRNRHFFGTSNDVSLLESGFLQRNMDDMSDNYHVFQEKLGKQATDPKLVSVMEYLMELYIQSQGVFVKIFSGHLHEHEMVKLLEKCDTVVSPVLLKSKDAMKVRTLQRSLSIGSPRPLVRGGDQESPLKLDYFKVRTVYTNEASPRGDVQGSQGPK
ncbi:hypothetical protein I3843_14G031000 [Carya illinoinensis]|nr:hypothetical protein I3843_14G031000 [Carya illinoinensis]